MEIILNDEKRKLRDIQEEMKRRVNLGMPLTEHEALEIQEFLSTKMMMERPGFDFGETETVLHGGRLEETALMERNRRWAAMGPKRPEPKTFDQVCDKSPASITLCGPLYEGRRGIERMLDKFRAKLAEVRETGKLT